MDEGLEVKKTEAETGAAAPAASERELIASLQRRIDAMERREAERKAKRIIVSAVVLAVIVILVLIATPRVNAAMRTLNQVTDTVQKYSSQLKELDADKLRDAIQFINHLNLDALDKAGDQLDGVDLDEILTETDFLPGRQDVLCNTAELMGQLLLSPVTRGGLLLPDYVESEREKMAELIRSRVNDKRGYAMLRCMEEMCCYEDYAVSRFGSEADCESIHYQKLTRHYRSILQTSPVEIFYCGRADSRRVARVFRDALSTLPRGEIDYDIGTDVRMNAVEAQPRYVEEEMNVSQGKLVIGFRLGDVMEEPDIAAIYVFNSVFGSGSTSKLFVNVREKLQLCYYAGSSVDIHKGIMLVSSGIEFDKFNAAKAEILSQLAEMKNGNITDDELNAAKSGIASALRSGMDSQGELEGFFLSQTLAGLDYGPMELAQLVEEVTKDSVVSVAKSVECDLVYFLKGSGEAAEDEEAEEDEKD